jgi:hypothetical protein
LVVAASVLLASLAFSDRITSGSYTYNDTERNGVPATVSDEGNLLEIDGVQYLYNDLEDQYEQHHPLGSGVIQMDDQGYRYLGSNSETGVATLYPL